MPSLIGQNLGPYRILEQIGQGGMATVYKAYQPSMDRHVAVKVLPPHFMQDPAFVERFEREARTIARLEHPHILPVHDYGQRDDGTTYIAMRYVDAGTLADLLKQNRLPLDEAIRLFTQIADALAYAHEQGVIHRDMKPSNVLVDPRGQSFLTDFGLARMIEGSSNLTGSMILGTPAYMAPELGEGRSAGERSDIYALGVILYEMITGRPPFEAETPLAVMLKHMTEPLPLPRELNPDIPEALEQVILKALAKEPEDRYQSVNDFISALQKAVADAPTIVAATKVAPPPPTPEPEAIAPVPAKRPAWLWPAVGALALLIIAGVAAVIFGGSGKDKEKEPASPPAAAVQAAPTEAEAATFETPTPPSAETEAPPPVSNLEPGWTHFTNTDDVQALALQDDLIWAGTQGGLVAWNRHNGDYQKYTTLDGVPYHSPEALLAAKNGVLWGGGEVGGVIRFDGEEWRRFDEDDGLPSSSVYSFFEASDGTILVGVFYSEEGISQFDGDNRDTADWISPDIPPIPVEFPKPVAFLEGEEGEFIVALTDEGGLLYLDGDEWYRFTTADGLPSDSINSIAFDAEGDLWVATSQRGGVGIFDGESFEAIPNLADSLVSILYAAPDGVLWLGTEEEGLWRFDGDTLRLYNEEDGLPEDSINAIVQDEEGMLWLGLDGSGLIQFDGQSFESWLVEDEAPINAAWQIVETDDARLWFVETWGSYILTVYDPAGDTWDTVDMPGDTWAAAFDPDGAWWLGTNEGLWRADPSGARQRFTTEDGLPGDEITALTFDDNGGLWVGTTTGLAYHHPDDEETPWRDFADSTPSQHIRTLYTAPNGDIWIGAQGDETHPAAAIRANDGAIYKTLTTGNPFQEELEAVIAFETDADGRLWAATHGGMDSLWRLDQGEWREFTYENGAPGEALTMAAQPDGAVWFGTWYSGLWRYHDDDGWQRFWSDDGLPGQAVFGLHAASDGSLWISTEGGIARYVPE